MDSRCVAGLAIGYHRQEHISALGDDTDRTRRYIRQSDEVRSRGHMRNARCVAPYDTDAARPADLLDFCRETPAGFCCRSEAVCEHYRAGDFHVRQVVEYAWNGCCWHSYHRDVHADRQVGNSGQEVQAFGEAAFRIDGVYRTGESRRL